jgi:Leucine-rich repeat (LRR) protein
LDSIPRSLRDLPGVSVLRLDLNAIGEIPDWLLEKQRITSLYLSFNRIARLPDSIHRLENLNGLA